MDVYRVKTASILPLGKQGENLARKIQFDISRWISTFGPGTVQLLHQRSGDEAPYPVAVEQDGTLAIWKVSSADTASAGTGRTELQYYVGDALAKSETWMTKVLPALGDASETPPEAQQGWVDQVLQAGAAAVESADRAENAAVRQPYPNVETGTWWVWDAESGAYTDTGVSYGTGGGGGTSDHDKLLGRDKAEQHPISAITGLEDALAGKQPAGSYLTKETDPTVPAWAKAETKPSYTAPEVGADPSGTATARVSEHNTEATAHGDIRLLIQGLTDRLNALADSDDTTLDQLSEIVAYIKSNRDLIAAVTTDKVSVGDIVNDLVTNVSNKPLSAAQGVALKALIDSLSEEIANLQSGGSGLTSSEKTAMLALFKAAAYTSDVSATITQLVTLWGGESGGGDSGGGETGNAYTVTNNLTNVTNSNAATSVEAGGYYSATLSAETGYNISVNITMGGVDITDSVYTEDGTILITEVTGDIVITAVAELATAPILYQLANTPVTANADLYEDTGLTFGSDSANGYTKAWTLVAKVKNMTAGYLWCVAGQANLSAKYENRWNGDVGNSVAHLATTICATVVRPSITQANPDEVSVVITKEALSVKTATLHYLNYAGNLQTFELVGTYGNFSYSGYAGNMMVGGQSAADFVGTIEEFTIYEGVATEEQIKSYLGVTSNGVV